MSWWVVDTSPRLARRLGLEPIGTLGLLLTAKLRAELGSLRGRSSDSSGRAFGSRRLWSRRSCGRLTKHRSSPPSLVCPTSLIYRAPEQGLFRAPHPLASAADLEYNPSRSRFGVRARAVWGRRVGFPPAGIEVGGSNRRPCGDRALRVYCASRWPT
jgi:hypothetical protein